MGDLRVGVLGPLFPDSFADNVLATLDAVGVSTVGLGSARPRARRRTSAALMDLALRVPRVEGSLQARLVERCRREEVKVVLALESSLLPSTVKALRRAGSAVVLWFPDAVVNLDRQLMFLGDYDSMFFKEPHLVERATKLLGGEIHYLPEACNPMWHRPPSPFPANSEIVVAGNMYPFRVRLLRRLAAAGLPLRIYGPRWSPWLAADDLLPYYSARYIARHEKSTVFGGAGAVLNSLHPSELYGVNCRLFEAAACGAAVLSEWRPALEECFVPDREVITFSSFEELVERAQCLLIGRDSTSGLRGRAAARAHAEHSYEERLRTLFATVGATL